MLLSTHSLKSGFLENPSLIALGGRIWSLGDPLFEHFFGNFVKKKWFCLVKTNMFGTRKLRALPRTVYLVRKFASVKIFVRGGGVPDL